MRKNPARAGSRDSAADLVLGNFKGAENKVRLSSYYEQKNSKPSTNPAKIDVQSASEPFSIEGMRSYNPDKFISSGLRALRLMVTAIRLHATGYTLPINEMLLPFVQYMREIPKAGRGGKSEKLEELGSEPYVLKIDEALSAFCNSIAPETAVYPIENATIVSYMYDCSDFQNVATIVRRKGVLYLVVTDRPMTRKEARTAMLLGFPTDLMPAKLR